MEEGAVRASACFALLITDLGLAATLAALVGRWQLDGLSSSWATVQRLRLHRWLTAGVWLAIGGHVFGLIVQVIALSDDGQPMAAVAARLLTDTHYGHAWLAGLVALAVLGLASRRRALRARGPAGSGWLSVAVFALAHASASHAAQQEAAGLQVAAQAVHVMAVSAWLGAAGLASRVRLPAMPVPATDRTDAAAWAWRLSTAATAALAVLVATGAFRAWHSVASWSALLSSEYGRLLTAKLVFVALAAALGATNRFFVLPGLVHTLGSAESLGRDRARCFHRILVVESIVLIGALSIATLLATSETPER